jgi:hypothetical protein
MSKINLVRAVRDFAKYRKAKSILENSKKISGVVVSREEYHQPNSDGRFLVFRYEVKTKSGDTLYGFAEERQDMPQKGEPVIARVSNNDLAFVVARETYKAPRLTYGIGRKIYSIKRKANAPKTRNVGIRNPPSSFKLDFARY